MRYLMVLFIVSASLIAQDKPSKDPGFSTYYLQKKSLFELLPNDQNEIIFLGNSITDGCEWSELFQNPLIKNRGISGDITDGVLARLNEVTESEPSKIFLMIGVNDLARGRSVDSILINYREIVSKIRQTTPNTELFLQSVLPVNAEYPRFNNHVNKSDSILIMNQRLQAIASEYGLTYIDLHGSFKNRDGQLDPAYSNDGLHLTGPGYLLWKKLINPYVSESEK